MHKKQLIAIGVLPLLVMTMTAIYRLLSRLLGAKRAWYAGFFVYWSIWCIFFPLKLLGFQQFRTMFSRGRLPKKLGLFIMALPSLLAFLGRFIGEKQPRKASERAALVFTAFLNGLLEEVLWRGVFMLLFPKSLMWGIVWPSIWFSLWHYGPGSVSPHTNVGALMGGAAFLGVAMGWLTRETKSVCGAAVSHTLAGLAQVLS